jgi:dual specificity phosphatase 12
MHGVKKYLESFYYTTWLYGKMRSYLQPYLSTKFNTNEIVPNLFIGDIASAYNKQELKELGITHVVTAILGVTPIFPQDFVYKNIPLRDIPGEHIDSYFIKSNEFISKAISGGGKVFVHCMCGVSRSATLVAAYLMYEYGLTCEAAVKLLQRKRTCVDPNEGFRQQLEVFQNSLQEIDITDTISSINCINSTTGKWIKRRNTI